MCGIPDTFSLHFLLTPPPTALHWQRARHLLQLDHEPRITRLDAREIDGIARDTLPIIIDVQVLAQRVNW
jgi:hypothetical protein